MTIGGAVCDVFIDSLSSELTVIDGPEAGEHSVIFPGGRKIELSAVRYAVGGGAANVACGLAKFGLPTAAFFKTGTDYTADFVRTNLALAGIEMRYATTDHRHPTGISFVLPSPSSDRTVLIYRGSNATIEEHELPCAAFGEFRGVYIAPVSGNLITHLPLIVSKAHEAGCRTMHNPSKPELSKQNLTLLLEALPYIDIIMLNKAEACCLYQLLTDGVSAFSTAAFFEELHRRGASIIIVTDGEKGAQCSTTEEFLHQPGFPTTVANTVGAGDSFGAAFFGAFLRGAPLQKALLFGALNSASVLGCPTPHGGLLSAEELEQKAAVIRMGDASWEPTFSEQTDGHETTIHS